MPEQTDTDTIYILSENAPTQIDNMVGLTEQINLPPGYSRTRLEPTPTQGVWRVQRTRRFNVEPLALSQMDVLYDKTTASTTTLAAATGGEMPITYSLPLIRGSQDRFDVPGAPVTFDPVARELNIGSGFDEGLEVNYTARDACNQVANARVIVRPMGTYVAPRFPTGSYNGDPYSETSGVGHIATGQGELQSTELGLPPYTAVISNGLLVDAGWSVSTSRDSSQPTIVIFHVTFGSWIFDTTSSLSAPAVRRNIPIRVTDFFGNADVINLRMSFS